MSSINTRTTSLLSLTLNSSFIEASGNARTKLRTSQEALLLAFSYFQVIPEFLDFLFLFGEQIPAQDLYCSGFHHQTRLDPCSQTLKDPVRAVSGADLKLCYSLKSIESSPVQHDWPWSIRHCAVHHTFDVQHRRSTWIIIKGNAEINKRIQSVTGSRGPADFASFDSITGAFTAALATHLLICDWSSESWRLYIKFLEERFAALTDEAININADAPLDASKDADLFTAPTRSGTQETFRKPQTTNRRILSWKSTQSRKQYTLDVPNSPIPQKPSLRLYTNASGKEQPMPPAKKVQMSSRPHDPVLDVDEFGQQQFSFRDMQKANDVEERVNECILVLRLNINVVTQLKDYYHSLMLSDEMPQGIRDNCRQDMARFERRVDGVIGDFNLQIIRAEGLLRLLADRKALVSVNDNNSSDNN